MSKPPTVKQVRLVSVIIPALNEGGSIRELHGRVTAQMKTLGLPYEIIFIDDGSTDDTNAILEEIRAVDAGTGYIRHFRSHGKSLALMQGFDLARGDIAVTLDGDLQDEPENIGLIIAEMRRGNFDLVNGCRNKRKDGRAKIFVSQLFNMIVRIIFKLPISDVNSGLKAYSRDLYKRIELHGDLHRLIPVIAFNNGYKVSEINISSSPRMKGRSKYKLLRYRGFLDIISLMALHSTQLRPFHIFGGLGVLLCAAAAAIVGAMFAFMPAKAIHHPEILLAMLVQALLLIGVMLFLIGLLAEMLTSSFHDADWRGKWIREIRAPGKSDNGNDSDP